MKRLTVYSGECKGKKGTNGICQSGPTGSINADGKLGIVKEKREKSWRFELAQRAGMA